MRFYAKEERSHHFGHDVIYYLSNLSTVQDVRDVLNWLISEKHTLLNFGINYIYDHADFRPPQSYSTEEGLMDALKNEDFEWLDVIVVYTEQNSKKVYVSLYPNSDMIRLSYPREK